MSTKIKGEAIKEGSIPLSALSTEVKNKIENAGGGADWNAKEGEVGYIENRTHCVITNKFITVYPDESYEIMIDTFPENIYYKGVIYQVPMNPIHGYGNVSKLILGNNEVELTFDLDLLNEGWFGFGINNTNDVVKIFYDVNVKQLSDIFIPDNIARIAYVNERVNNKLDKSSLATNTDIDVLFENNDYYGDYYGDYSIMSLRNTSNLYYSSETVDTNFKVDNIYFNNNKCISHNFDDNLNVGIITFDGYIPSKEEINQQYDINIDYIEYE